MNKNASLRLSEKDIEILETLKKAYNISNTSELLRVLLKKEYHNLNYYEGLKQVSDKQIFTLGLYDNCSTKSKGGKIYEQTPQSSKTRRKSIS